MRPVTEKRGPCPVAVVFRDGADRDTVVRTACAHVSSSSAVSHRGQAPASSGAIYRSTTNRLQVHATWSGHHHPEEPDQHWTPYILQYTCKLNDMAVSAADV